MDRSIITEPGGRRRFRIESGSDKLLPIRKVVLHNAPELVDLPDQSGNRLPLIGPVPVHHLPGADTPLGGEDSEFGTPVGIALLRTIPMILVHILQATERPIGFDKHEMHVPANDFQRFGQCAAFVLIPTLDVRTGHVHPAVFQSCFLDV